MLESTAVENDGSIFGVHHLPFDDQLTSIVVTERYDQGLADVVVVFMRWTNDVFVQVDGTKMKIWRNEAVERYAESLRKSTRIGRMDETGQRCN